MLLLVFPSIAQASISYEQQDSSIIRILSTEDGERVTDRAKLRVEIKQLEKEISKLTKKRQELIDALNELNKKDFANAY